MLNQKLLPTADQRDDLHLVAFLEQPDLKIPPRHEIAIDLDGHLPHLQLVTAHQCGHAGAGIDLFLTAVHNHVHARPAFPLTASNLTDYSTGAATSAM